jgi:hypothetical protein
MLNQRHRSPGMHLLVVKAICSRSVLRTITAFAAAAVVAAVITCRHTWHWAGGEHKRVTAAGPELKWVTYLEQCRRHKPAPGLQHALCYSPDPATVGVLL